MTEPTITDADSGFTPENIAHAEWLWANLPVGATKFHDRPTHERALVCHTVARFREASTAELRQRLVASTESMERTLAAMDRYNEQNGTAIIGPSLLTLGKMIAANRKALGGHDD